MLQRLISFVLLLLTIFVCDYQYLILSQEIIFFYLFIYLAVIWDIWDKPYHGHWHHSCLYKTCGVNSNDLTLSLTSYIMTYHGAGVLTSYIMTYHAAGVLTSYIMTYHGAGVLTYSELL